VDEDDRACLDGLAESAHKTDCRIHAYVRAGDLCLILVDQVEEALSHIAKRIAEN
jgi:hypothetical protein